MNVSKVFISIASIFGLLYVFIIPPFQAPDEVHQFYKTYQVAEGVFLGEKTDDQRYGGKLPESLQQISVPFRPVRGKNWVKTSRETIINTSKIRLEPTKEKFLDFPNVAYYSPVGYLPQATVVAIIGFWELNPLYLFYLSRIAGLFFWIFLISIAIRTIPFHQHSLAFLALLPASLFFHAGINPDALTHAFAFLLLAFLLKIALTDVRLKKRYLLLLVLSAVITINKVVYAPIILLAWLIPVEKFASRKQYYALNIGLLFFHACLLLAWYKVASGLFITYENYNPLFRKDVQLNPDVNPLGQLHFVLSNPGEFLEILYNSYKGTLPWTWKHYVGKFGWEGNYLPNWLSDFWWYLIIVVAITDASGKKILFRTKYRIVLVSVSLIMVLAFSVVIYMQWSPVGFKNIESLSGRYFIPIFPLLWLALKNNVKFMTTKLHLWVLVFFVLFSQVYAILAVLERYYA